MSGSSTMIFVFCSLALIIASRHPNLSGLDLENATLITPNQSHKFIRTAVEKWIYHHPELYLNLLAGKEFDGEETENIREFADVERYPLPTT